MHHNKRWRDKPVTYFPHRAGHFLVVGGLVVGGLGVVGLRHLFGLAGRGPAGPGLAGCGPAGPGLAGSNDTTMVRDPETFLMWLLK